MAQIIVVEDDVYMREELIDVLEKAGYDAVPLLDFENAVSQIMSLSPDLILLDINLPFHSGFEICKEVSNKPFGMGSCLRNGFISIRKHFYFFMCRYSKYRDCNRDLLLICIQWSVCLLNAME